MIEVSKDLELTITIPQMEYKQLLDLETRVDVAVERMTNDECCKIEDVLRILGTELALQKADEIRDEEKEKRKAFLKKQGGKIKMEYEYLVERKRDGKLFFAYGDFKRKALRPGNLFKAVGEDYLGCKYRARCFEDGFDLYVKNISCDVVYDSKKFRVIYQKAYDWKKELYGGDDRKCINY